MLNYFKASLNTQKFLKKWIAFHEELNVQGLNSWYLAFSQHVFQFFVEGVFCPYVMGNIQQLLIYIFDDISVYFFFWGGGL